MAGSHIDEDLYEEQLAMVNHRMEVLRHIYSAGDSRMSDALAYKIAFRMKLKSGGYDSPDDPYISMIISGRKLTDSLKPMEGEYLCLDAYMMLTMLRDVLNLHEIGCWELNENIEYGNEMEDRYPEYPEILKQAISIYQKIYSYDAITAYKDESYMFGWYRRLNVDRVLPEDSEDLQADMELMRNINEEYADECCICRELWGMVSEDCAY